MSHGTGEGNEKALPLGSLARADVRHAGNGTTYRSTVMAATTTAPQANTLGISNLHPFNYDEQITVWVSGCVSPSARTGDAFPPGTPPQTPTLSPCLPLSPLSPSIATPHPARRHHHRHHHSHHNTGRDSP
ncbi:hypothetical protein E2C01_009169 [Portunus trituberculatus]|uniref:Uncharacterized protein n=1 Tax=Portunus trituberculatus TaxID=210409 RepID=A0A5B7D5C2_PORTR|nr:hypothetical protein [Portunus trituberculatus]